ncbi:MAG: NYN domain-containing protein [Clostridia bacterium]|nr:NYN domain-containing protein [Clostridia bacterium]
MKSLLYVDGYNVIGAWGEAQRQGWPIDECRDRLARLLEDYAGYTDQEVWLVFDGHKADRPVRSIERRGLVTLVYTRHGETADQYIERMCGALPRFREARVATSDRVEQVLILGRGATRLSARELLGELSAERNRGQACHRSQPVPEGSVMRAALNEEQYARLERLRRQKT